MLALEQKFILNLFGKLNNSPNLAYHYPLNQLR